MTSGVACHHRLWEAQTVERCRAWHDIIALGRQTRSNDVRHDMPLPPLDSTHGQTTSSVACHYQLWAAHTVKRRRPWHAIIAFGQHKRSNSVGRGVLSSPLCSTSGRTVSGLACHHCLWAAHSRTTSAWHAIIAFAKHIWSNDVGRGMPSSTLGSTNDRMMSGMACHHRLCEAHTVERRRAWPAIIGMGLGDTVGRRRV